MSGIIPKKAGGLLPLAGICCLGLTGFLVAATIVLALIPIYTPRKDVTVMTISDDENRFLLEYQDSTSNTSDGRSGAISNINDLSSALGAGSDFEVTDAYASSTYESADTGKRRRSLLHRRQKRFRSIMKILLRCRYKVRKGCTGRCRQNFISKVNGAVMGIKSLSNLKLTVLFGSVSHTLSSLNFGYSGIFKQPSLLTGYGSVDSLDFVPIASGDFNDPKVWKNGIRPFRGCRVSVPAGIGLTLSGTSFPIPLLSLTVAKGGTLSVGTAGVSGFIFPNPIALAISGTFGFLGSGGLIRLSHGCNFQLASGSIYAGAAASFQMLNALGILIGRPYGLFPGIISALIGLFGDGIILSGGTTYNPSTNFSTTTEFTTVPYTVTGLI